MILRPQEISNHPELIRRLGVIAMNGLIEADIYGNVNSTHVTRHHDHERHRRLGRLRPQRLPVDLHDAVDRQERRDLLHRADGRRHVDHTEHDVQVIVTEQGLADLRGLAPRHRAERIIENCAHPAYRPALEAYYERALRGVARPSHPAPDERSLCVP